MPFGIASIGVPFRMQPGLARLGADREPQLTPSAAGGRHLREKTAVLAAFPGRALAGLDAFDARPALAAVAAESGGAFAFDGPVDAVASALGWSVRGGEPAGTGEPAIGVALARLPAAHRVPALACLAFEEDLAILDGATGTVPWLAVALPSRWAPETKAGLSLAALHAPVADADAVRAAGDRLVALATSGGRFERFVWTVSPDPRLHQHPSHGDAAWGDPADAAFRHERQTFVPVPGTRQAVFTIRVRSELLGRAVRSADDARRLRGALASMTPAVLDYKGLAGVRDRLLAWLDAVAAAFPGPADAPRGPPDERATAPPHGRPDAEPPG